MADDFSGIVIKIDLANSKNTINTQMTEIQNWFKNNHNLKIDLNISDSALKGLEKLGKEFGNTVNDIRSKWKDVTKDIESLSNIKNLKIDLVDSKAVQKIGEIKTATGETLQITQKLINLYDDAGKIIGSKWVESTRTIQKLNQDTVNKMRQDLTKFQSEFQNNILKLDGSKSNSYIDKNALKQLQSELNKININDFNIPQDLKAKLDGIKSSFDKIKISAENASKGTSKNSTETTEAVQKEINSIDRLIKEYKAAKISATEFMDAGLKIYNSGKLSGNTTVELDQRIRLLNALKTAQKEYDSVINQEGKTNSGISNNAYTQQKQALESIYSLLKQKMDAEKKGQAELTTQLQEQIRLEGQKYTLARQNIKSNGLTDSSREIEFLNLKNALQTEYNNRKIREGDISRQNALDTQHWLSIQQQDFASQSLKFTQQKSGLYDVNELNRLQREMATLTPTTENVRQRVDQLRASFRSLDAQAVASGLNNANKSAMSFGESIQVAAYKMGIWLGVGNLIFGVISQLKESLVFLSEMNQGFTNMSLEMTDVNLNFNEITQSANSYAIAMGTTTTAIMKGLEVFSTYTSTLDESIKKTQAAAIMSNITGQSMTDSADQLMGTLAQYRLGAEDALGIVDTIASVSRNLQVDFPKAVSEISNGMRTVGAVSAEAGVSVQELSGMLGTLVETTRRSGSQVANGLKMIFSRLGNVGEDTNPEEFKKVENSLYNIGVVMKDSATSIKPASVLLSEIASKWSTLNDIERQATATAVSSIYQRNIFVSLMQNYDKVLQNTTSATDANGVALQKQDIYMKSLKAHTSEFVTSLQGLYLSMANQDTLKGVVDAGTGIVNVFSKLSSVLGTIPVLLGTVVAGVSLFSRKFRESVIGSVGYLKVLQTELVKTNSVSVIGFGGFASNGLLSNMRNFSERMREIRTQLALTNSTAGTSTTNFSSLGVAFQALTGRTIGYTAAMVGARIATIAWQATLTVGLSFAISAIISNIISFTQQTQKANEAFDTLTKSISSLKQETSELPSLISSYEELFNKVGKTSEEKEKLASATAKLSSLFGDSVIGLDSEGKAYEIDIEYVKQLTEAKKEFLRTQQEELASKFNSTGESQYKDLSDKQKRIAEIDKKLAKQNKELSDAEKYSSEGHNAVSTFLNNEGIESYKKSIADLASERAKLTGESNEIQQTLAKEAYAFDQSSDSANKLSQSLINNLARATVDSGKGFNDLKETMEVFKNQDVSNAFKKISEDISKGANTEKATKDMDEFRSVLVKNNVDTNIAAKLIRILNDAMKIDNAPNASNKIAVVTNSTEELASSLKDVTSVATDVSKAMEEYNKTGKLSSETIVDLVTKYPELIDQLKVENGQLILNKEAVQSLLDVRINSVISSLEAEKNYTTQQAEETKKRITNLISEAEAIGKRNDALNALPTFLKKPTINPSTGTVWINEEDRIRAEASALKAQLDADNGVDDKIASMKALLGKIQSSANSGNYPSSSSKSNSASNSQTQTQTQSIQSITDALLAQIRVESDLQKAKSDSLQKQISQATSEKDYQKTLTLTNELIASQAKELELLQTARSRVNQLKDSAISSSKFRDTSRWFTGNDNTESTAFVTEKNKASEDTRKLMDEEFKSMQALRNGWVSYTKAIDDNIVASKAFAKTSKDDLVKSIQEQAKSISDAETSTLEKSFKNLNIEEWVKKNVSSTKTYQQSLQELQTELAKLGNPKTYEAQLKYNDIMKQSAKLVWDAKKAQDELQKSIESARMKALYDSMDAEMQAITDQIDNLDTQINLVKDGKSSLNTVLDYTIVPTIDYNSMDEAEVKLRAERNANDFELNYTPPYSFVEFINNDLTNSLSNATTVINGLKQKIAELGEVTPQNKDQILSYYKDIQTQINLLSDDVIKQQDSLLIQLSQGKITQEDFDLKMSQIKVANLSVLAVPIIEMNEETQASIDRFKTKVSALPVNADTTAFSATLDKLIKEDYDTTITAILNHTVADQEILKLTAPSVKVITVQTVSVPIPQNAKGTNSHRGGLAEIDDGAGNEIIIEPNKKPYIYKEKGSKIVDLPKETEIIPAEESKEILKKNNIPSYASGTMLRGGRDEGKIDGMSGGVWYPFDGYMNGKYTPAHWVYQGIPYYPPNDPDDPANSNKSNTTSPTSSSTSNKTSSAPNKTTTDTLTATATSSVSEMVELIDKKISLWDIVTSKAKDNIGTLTAQMTKNSDGNYADTDDNRETAEKINAQLSAQRSAQLAIKALVKERYEAEWAGFDKSQKNYDDQLDAYSKHIEFSKLIGKSNEEIVTLEKGQLTLQTEKSQELQTQVADLRTQLKSLDKSSEEYNIVYTKLVEVNSELLDVNTNIYNITQEIADLDLENITKPFNDIQEILENSLSYAEKLIALMKLQGKSQEEISAVTKQNILDQQEKLVSEEAELKVLEDKLSIQKEGTNEWKEAKAAVDAQKKAILDTKTAITQTYSDIADEIIEAYKTAYKKQEEIALAAIDKEKDAFDDMIDDKLKKLNNDSSLEDYGEELKTMQDEALETEKKRDALSLDNSIEGKAKKLELSKTLAEQEAAIAKKRRHHDVELQTASLNEQKENNDKAVELEKEAVTEKFDALINDEEKYAEIRQQIYAGNFAQIQSDFAKFNADFLKQNQTTCEGLKISYSDLVNTIKQVTTATNSLGSLSSTPIPDATPKVTSPIVTPKNDSGLITSKNKVIPYLVNKGAISASEFNDLEAQNFTTQAQIMGYLIKKGYITTAEYNDLEAHVKFKEGGETSKKGLIWADGELGKPERILSGEQTQSFNSLVKNLPSITTVLDKIVLNNPLQNIMSNFAMPSFSNNLAGAMTGGATYNLNLNIESLNGDKSGADFLFSSIGNNIKKMGGKW